MNAHDKLLKYLKQINDLQYTINILDWDLRVNSPEDAKDALIDLISDYELKLFKLEKSKKYETLLKDCIASIEYKALDEAEQRCIKILLKNYEKNASIPDKVYQEYVKLSSKTNHVWESAKEKDDYETFKPYLKKLIEATKKLYSYKSDKKNIYDAMLEDYQEGMTTKEIDPLFDEIKKALIPLIKKASHEKKVVKPQKCTSNEQMQAAKYLLNYIGFDMNKGALGIYPHGYTEKIADNDIRIAFNSADTPDSFVETIIHEGGHGIFEQNIKHHLSRYSNACVDRLTDLHESESRFFENILGRNKNFWIPIYDDIKNILKLDLSLNEFVDLLNEVRPSLIRTQADELTYSMHIIIRYELERDLFNGSLSVDDLPAAWNKLYKKYLGVDVLNNKDGLMQDVHWSEGAFGYFPSYLLGNIYDGMLLDVIEENVGSINELLKSGHIKDITDFLIDKIYVYGGAYNSKEVIKRLTGKEISAKPIIKYFENKYNK
jgi:carboxypeptidase Taq